MIDPFSSDRAIGSLFEKTWEVTVTTGTIKKVVAERGFGFITAEDTNCLLYTSDAADE